MDCIFCNIAKKEWPASIVYEDGGVLGFHNVKPEAPVHILFIPKLHFQWSDEFGKTELALLAELVLAAKKVAKEKKIFDAYKLVFNVGRTGHIPHIHLHLLGGWKDKVPMGNVPEN